MTETKDKYSLCIVPTGKAYNTLKTLIDELALSHNSPSFVPHVTLIGSLFSAPSEYKKMLLNIQELASKLPRFQITLDEYGYMEEMYRCVYLLAHAPEFNDVFETTAESFPEVKDQHFQSLPHLSVLYGFYSSAEKEKVIATHPLPVLDFDVNRLKLFLTNGTAESWKEVETFPLTK
jgi:2'-5' RNA ligase